MNAAHTPYAGVPFLVECRAPKMMAVGTRPNSGCIAPRNNNSSPHPTEIAMITISSGRRDPNLGPEYLAVMSPKGSRGPDRTPHSDDDVVNCRYRCSGADCNQRVAERCPHFERQPPEPNPGQRDTHEHGAMDHGAGGRRRDDPCPPINSPRLPGSDDRQHMTPVWLLHCYSIAWPVSTTDSRRRTVISSAPRGIDDRAAAARST